MYKAECPTCGGKLLEGVLRTDWIVVHDAEIADALSEVRQAREAGRSINVYGGQAYSIAHRLHPAGEKQFHCRYCPRCEFVAFSRSDAISPASQIDFS